MSKSSNPNKEINITDFKKGKRISKNSFTSLYNVEEKKTGKLYAANVIDCEDDEEKVNKINDQIIEDIMSFQNSTIIDLIGYSKIDFQDENNFTIIMNLTKNGSLNDIINSCINNEQPKDYTNTTRQIIITGIARGMKLLHNKDFILRNLNANNVLLDENFHPVINNFYITKILEICQLQIQNQTFSNVRYQAPEVITNGKIDKKADVYAYGILIYEILNNSFSYPELEKGDISDLDFRNKVVKENYRPKFNNPINPNLQKLIEDCWSEDPEKRPTFDEIFYLLSSNNNSDKNSNDYFLENVDRKVYSDYINEISDENEQILSKISFLEKENVASKNEIKRLTDQLTQLQKENEEGKNLIKKLKEEVAQLKGQKETPNNDAKKSAEASSPNETTNNQNSKSTNNDIIAKAEKQTPKTVQTAYPNIFEKNEKVDTVCIDNGTYMTRCGFGGYEAPKDIYYTAYTYFGSKEPQFGRIVERPYHDPQWPIENGIITKWNEMEKLWEDLFKCEMKVLSNEHPVILSESVNNTKENREKTIEIMFETFNVPAFYLSKQELFALYTARITHGIVLNVGQQVTTAVPLYEKPTVKNDIMCSYFGGLDITKCLKKHLVNKGHDFASTCTQFYIDFIKECHGYVALDYQKELQSPANVKYKLPDSSTITLSDELFKCSEGLFEPTFFDSNCDGVDKILYDSINSNRYCQDILYSNIVLSGCTTLLKGFPERLEKELIKRTNSNKNIKIITSPYKNYTVWTGESILSGVSEFPKIAINLNEYKENGKYYVNVKCY